MADSYENVKAAIKTAFETAPGVVNDMDTRGKGDKTPKPLLVEAVGIAGSPDSGSLPGNFSNRIEDADGKNTDRFDVAVKIKELMALNEPQVKEAALKILKALYSKVGMPGGKSLADSYDWSVTPPKTQKEKLAELKALIGMALTQSPNVVPPEVAVLLTQSKFFNRDDGDRYYYGGNSANAAQGHVEVSFDVSNKNEKGEKSNAATIKENILARKDAILAAIRESTKAAHANSISEADLQNLDLQVSTQNYEWGESVAVRVGGKIAPSADPNQKVTGENPVGPTKLAELSKENIQRIITDSILLKGAGADQVAPMITTGNDIKHFLNLYKDKAPLFDAALKSEVLALNYEDRKKVEKEQKIRPVVSLDTSLDDKVESKNTLHILSALPDGISHTQVAVAIAAPAPATVTPPVTPAAAEPSAPGFASENLKAPVLTAKPPADSATERLQNQTPSVAGAAL